MLLKLGKLGSAILTIVFFTANANADITLATQKPDGNYSSIHSVTITESNLSEGTENSYDDAAIYSCSVSMSITAFKSTLNLITLGWTDEEKSQFLFVSPVTINDVTASYNIDDLQIGTIQIGDSSNLSAKTFFGTSTTSSATGTEVYISGDLGNLADDITIKFNVLGVAGILDDLNLQLRFSTYSSEDTDELGAIAVPEPATMLMFWLGAAGIAATRRIRLRRK